MTTYTWNSSVSGNWNTAADWAPAGRPNSNTADALIETAGSYAVSISGGETFTANQVTLDAAGATLKLASGGTLTLAGTAAALVLNAGTFDLAGLLQGGNVEADGATVQLGGTLEGVTWVGPLAFGPGEGLTVVDGLTVETAAGTSPGTIDMSAGGDTLVLTSGETLDNAILNFSGNGDDIDTTTGGTVTLGSGFTLDSSGTNNGLPDATMINAGLFNVSGGTLTDFYGNLVNSGAMTLGGGGVLQFDVPFGVGTPETGITNSGSITIGAGGVLNVSSTFGTLTNTGSVTIGAGGELAAFQITANTGHITVDSGGLLSVVYLEDASGIVALDNGGTFLVASFNSSQPFIDNGLLEVGYFAADGITIASGATLIGGLSNIIGSVTDTGLVEANGGVMQLQNAVIGTGVLQVDAGAGLQLDSSGSAKVDFAAVGGTLVLEEAGGFIGTIDGFTIGDTIDLPNVAYDPSGTATMLAGNTLQVVENAGTYDFKFDPAQSFTGDYFHPTPDGTAIIENTVPPYYIWTTAISGDWGTGADWTPAGPPDAATANAVIDTTGSYTVSIGGGESFLANALTLTATDATLSVAGTLTLTELISDGLIDIAGGALDISDTLNNAGIINIAVGGTLGLQDTLNNAGGITIAAGGTLDLQNAWTLSGGTVAGLGSVTSTGGLLLVGGSLDLGGGTLDVAATGPLSEFGVAGELADGTVDANAGAILLETGAILNDVTWQGTLTISATESVVGVTGGNGINVAGGSLINDGAIAGGAGSNAYNAGSGGNGVNATGSSLTNNGTVTGGAGGNGGTRFGGSRNSSGNGGNGIVLTSSTLTNNVTIVGGGAGYIGTMGGLQYAFGGDGVVAIKSALTNDGAITGGTGIGGSAGVYGSGATLTNNAAITGGAVVGAFVGGGGSGVDIKSSLLTNDGTITGGYSGYGFGAAGVSATGGSVTNNGTVAGTYGVYGGAGVDVTNSTLTNNGLIIGGNASEFGPDAGDGVDISNTILTNNGSIIAGSDGEPQGTNGIGVVFTGGGTLKDTGFISGGTYAGVVADAVNFGTGTSRLILHPGASFDGDVVTEGSIATLELASAAGTGTITDIGSSFAGFGTITVDPAATWVAQGPVTGSGTFDLGAASRLTLNGSVDATSPVYFTAAAGRLGLGDPAGFAATVYGFQPGNAIDFTSITSTGSIAAGVNGSNDLTLTSGGILLAEIKLDPAQDFSSDVFHAAPDGGTGTVVTDAPICFLRGTMIATPAGEIPIEHLAVGDLVVTARRAVRPIVWIGIGRVLATRGRRSDATPVIVRKGALADNVPCRDLRVTKAHAVEVDGVLIPVEFLVNHRSILWDDHAQEILLYHIELETHDVLLANGAPAESYRDDGNRWLFHNANSGWDLPAQPPCAPVLTGGPVVDAAWLRLLERSGPRRAVPLTDDPDLHLVVDGRRVDAATRHGEWQSFELSGQPEAVRIVSRSAVPQELGLARDPRCLGVALRQIMLRQGTHVRIITAADAALAEGFHKFEPGDAIRWTNGDAVIAAALLEGFTSPLELLLCLGGTTRYLVASQLLRAA